MVIKSLDWEKDRISLSYKETLADPWNKAAEQFPVGSTHTGTVVRMAQFGSFITLAPGVDGLIHISKLGTGRRIHHPREVMEEGQNIEVTIENVDLDERRISLLPSDYVSAENEEADEKKEYKSYQSQGKKKKADKQLGTLGELLQARMAEKKKK